MYLYPPPPLLFILLSELPFSTRLLPVLAAPTRSLPSRRWGIVWAWISVIILNPISSIPFSVGSQILSYSIKIICPQQLMIEICISPRMYVDFKIQKKLQQKYLGTFLKLLNSFYKYQTEKNQNDRKCSVQNRIMNYPVILIGQTNSK